MRVRPMAVSLALMALTLILLVVPARGWAVTRYVNHTDSTCGGRSPCYTTIQAAVNAVLAGETVLVQAGTYVEQVLVQGKNNTANASETDRIAFRLIRRGPSAA